MSHRQAKISHNLHHPPHQTTTPQAQGPILSYKVKPAEGWKIANEASPKIKTIYSSITYKAQKGE